MMRGKLQGAARTTSNAMSWPPDDAPLLLRRNRKGGVVPRPPALNFDEGEPPALERHEVDLADRCRVAARHDAVASQPKEDGNERLGEDAPGDRP
jgi:hypothetical protein